MDFIDFAVRRYLASMASPAPAEDEAPLDEPEGPTPGLIDTTN